MDIVFYGGHYWDRGAWFRKQQFAQRFANKGHRVFYIEDSVSMIRRTKDNKNEYFKTKVTKVNDNLFVITPSAIFPFPRHFSSRKLYNSKLFNDIKKILKKFNVSDFIFWSNKIESSTLFHKIKNTKILDLCDDLPFYSKLSGDEKNYTRLMKYLSTALYRSNIQIVSAQKIKEKYSSLTNNEILVIPNGHNIKLSNRLEYPAPDELKKIRKPVVGFLGTLFRFTDDLLLEYLVSNCPDYNFVFVGDVEENFPVQKLTSYKNVHLLGKKPKDEIPFYINSFDVCINPFKVHEVNDSVNPVKVFEYLALKKHVISTYMYSLMKESIAQYITFAKSYEEFLYKLNCVIKENNFTNNIPDKAIENYHWDNLFLTMLSELKNRFNLEL